MFETLTLVCLALTLICLAGALKITLPIRDNYRPAFYFIIPGIIFGIGGIIFGLLSEM